MLFAPTAEDMYPKGYHTYVAVDEITARLCGASRPGHFRGVTTVVLKFFNIVQPDCAVFGQKDAQQAIVIRRMVDDLNLGVRIVVAPTAREADGLAMSSRNVYLTSDERAAAPAIRRGLQRAEEAYRKGARSSTDLKALVADEITAAALLTPEYVELVDTRTIEPVGTLSATALLAVACRTAQSKTRLIDNVILGGTL
jgi:pantoate--beta-alanine ligase